MPKAWFETATATIAALASLFPRTFVAEQWQPHRPLKIGIDLGDRYRCQRAEPSLHVRPQPLGLLALGTTLPPGFAG
jgi:hypothetical protein